MDESGDDGELLQDGQSGDMADDQATHSPHVAVAVDAREAADA